MDELTDEDFLDDLTEEEPLDESIAKRILDELAAEKAPDRTTILLESGKKVTFSPETTELRFRESWDKVLGVSCAPGLKTIPRDTFRYCEKLKRLTLREGLEEIGAEAFFSCDALEEVTIPKSVKQVGDRAFALCYNLRRITILSPETLFGYQAFYPSDRPEDRLMILPRGSVMESYAVEEGLRYAFTDGTEPEKHSEVRVSEDGTLLENCYFRVEYLWVCCAENDGGIDERRQFFRYYRIPASLLTGEKADRICGSEHTFLIDDPSTHEFTKAMKDGYAGGWGDIHSKVVYRLFIGPMSPYAKTPITEEKMPDYIETEGWRLF